MSCVIVCYFYRYLVNRFVVGYIIFLNTVCLTVVILRKNLADVIFVGSCFVVSDRIKCNRSVFLILCSADLVAVLIREQEAKFSSLQIPAFDQLACAERYGSCFRFVCVIKGNFGSVNRAALCISEAPFNLECAVTVAVALY